jgi:hypothetical protein
LTDLVFDARNQVFDSFVNHFSNFLIDQSFKLLNALFFGT